MDTPNYFRFIAALLIVLAMLYGCLLILQRLAPKLSGWRAKIGSKRLGVVETFILDPRRRLVLIRRDDKEHLILCGTGEDLLIETNIIPPAGNDQNHDQAVSQNNNA